MKYYVYVLKSEEGYRYIGQSRDVERRMSEHNEGKSDSTKHGKNWKVIHLEEYETRKEAMKRERYLKTSAGRRYLVGSVYKVMIRMERDRAVLHNQPAQGTDPHANGCERYAKANPASSTS